MITYSKGAIPLRAILLTVPVSAQQFAVDFEVEEDGQAGDCPLDIVSDFIPSRDGLLAVRIDPGSQYIKIDELHSGVHVRPCAGHRDWREIYYRERRRKGWVHGNWLIPGAG